jgi:type 1 glutamine amidotransferase
MSIALLASLLAASITPAPGGTDHSAAVRVLLVTGVDIPAHNWKATAPALKRILEQDGRSLVRIVEDPDVLATDDIFDYDVVVLHFRNEKPLPRESQARSNLQRLVKQGRGLVLIHFACGAFSDWPGFGELAGMVWDGKNTHDPRGPFDVHIVGSHHPIMAGLGDFRADDELYIGLAEQRPVEVLATARSKVTGRDHPMAFAFQVDKGRVFHTPLGHDVKALEMPGTAELIRRGCQWAAGREPTAPRTQELLGPAMSDVSAYERRVNYGPNPVCIDTFDPAKIKPYIAALAPLRGANVLRDSPFDHKHHHGLMLAFKVNGINFWEEAPGCGHEKYVEGSFKIDFESNPTAPQRIRLSHRFHWVAEPDAQLKDTGAAALLIEDRTLDVISDESTNEVALRWHSEFEVGSKAANVTLTGANYHGLGMRFGQDLDPLATHSISGRVPDLSGAKQDVSPGLWGAVAFDVPGKPATVAIFGSPQNPGGETKFFSMKHPFAYLSATPGLDQKPLDFKSGDKFTFDYLVTLYPEIKSANFLAKRAERWVRGLAQKTH